MPARSVARAMIPSSASISRTRWPLPSPPMAGLQDISPIVVGLWVTRRVRAPRRAAAAAASQPACPPPTTMTSKISMAGEDSRGPGDGQRNGMFHVKRRSCTSWPRTAHSGAQKHAWLGVVQLKVVVWISPTAVSQSAPRARLLGPLLSDAKLAENAVEDLLHIDPARDTSQRPGRQAKILCLELRQIGIP